MADMTTTCMSCMHIDSFPRLNIVIHHFKCSTSLDTLFSLSRALRIKTQIDSQQGKKHQVKQEKACYLVKVQIFETLHKRLNTTI